MACPVAEQVLPADERQLLEQAVAGDGDALGNLLRQHAPHIARELHRDHPVLSESDVEDVMQVTFLDAFLHASRFDPTAPGSFGGWLRTIARNNVSDLIRQRDSAKRPPRDRRLVPDPEGSITALLDELVGISRTPSRLASAGEAQRLLESALKELPESHRQVVRLYDLEGQHVDEVGRALGRSAGAVYMLRARAHERLREILGSESRFFSGSA